jgi:hypothetical protein
VAAAALALFVAAGCSSRGNAPSRDGTETKRGDTYLRVQEAGGSRERVGDDEAREIMYTLIRGDASRAQSAVDRVLRHRDPRFVPVFIELVIAGKIGVVRGAGFDEHLRALESLSGEDFGNDWTSWVSWYGTTGLSPPPGFTGWKGEIYSRVDPRFGSFLTDDAASRIRVEEILWGGVRVDGIPALDDPPMIEAGQAEYLEAGEPVFGVSIGGDARAYPLRIMDWHEMANDVVGGVPLSLAYCTLCGAGIAFDGRGPGGEVYTFGSSGFLYRSNKLMYDRQTDTLWNQLTGRPVLGELAGRDLELKTIPVVLTSWKRWRESHPETVVLSLDTGYERRYEPAAPYGHYFSSENTMFPVWKRDDLLPAKARVFALRVEGVPKAYPLDVLLDEGVVNDYVGHTGLVLIAWGEKIRVAGVSLRAGPVIYSAGAEVRAYERKGVSFERTAGNAAVVDSRGREWTLTEEVLIAPDGTALKRLGGHLAYWFGWYAFFPDTLVYGASR